MTRLAIYVLATFAVFLALVLAMHRCRENRIERGGRMDGRTGFGRIPTTDTFRVAKTEPVRHKSPVVVPPTVAVASIPDSVLRRKMEKSTMIVSLEKRKPKRRGLFRKRQGTDTLAIQTISPIGIVHESRYPWRWVEHGDFTVDSAGRLRIDPVLSEKGQAKAARREKRKGVWRTVKATAVAVSVAAAAFLVLR